MNTRIVMGVAVFVLLAAPARGAGRAAFAQRIVDEFVADHPELVGLQLSVAGSAGCRTVAATAREEVGMLCDARELGPIHTGTPAVKPPTRKDPIYDVTQALHDTNGALVGAAGMELSREAGGSREAVLKHARKLLAELEERIPSKERLLER